MDNEKGLEELRTLTIVTRFHCSLLRRKCSCEVLNTLSPSLPLPMMILMAWRDSTRGGVPDPSHYIFGVAMENISASIFEGSLSAESLCL